MKQDNCPLNVKDYGLIHEILRVFSRYEKILVPALENPKDRRLWRNGRVDGGHKLIGKVFQAFRVLEDEQG